MPLTASQAAIVAHGEGPARVIGSYASGRTTALRARIERLAERVGPERVLALTRSAGAARHLAAGATTVWGLALGILERSGRPRRLMGFDEQRHVVADLLEGAPAQWPVLRAAAGDRFLLAEVADAVCHYQASWLGLEELRTHAEAAGQAEPWEELADLTRAYREVLDRRGAVDWAGALVQAGLALRDPARADAERKRFDHVVVDDFEQTSFAAHRLLASLVGPGGNIVVAGNPDAPVPPTFGGDRRWFERFPRSYGARLDVALDRRLAPSPERVTGSVEGSGVEGEVEREVERAHQQGAPWSAIGVVVCSAGPEDERDVRARLQRRGVPAVAGPGRDPWDAGDESADAVVVTSPEGAAGRTWPVVVAVGCRAGHGGPPHPRLLDLELLAGPDVPSPAERAARWTTEQRRRAEQVASRATRRLVLVD